jgi:hypothetical protein
MQTRMHVRMTKSAFLSVAILIVAESTGAAVAAPAIEFDFARIVECGDSSSTDRTAERLIKVSLPVSVRFRDVLPEDVEEINVEINGSPAGLRVVEFAPVTRLASDIRDPIRVTTTTKRAASLDGSLGGTLPIPYADLVAHLTPTINAGTSRSESATETTTRLPPQQAVVVSGTSAAGQGVFFKFKSSSQTSLEGVHELSVTFVAPADWNGGTIRLSCSAIGQRRILWLKQPGTLGRAAGDINLRVLRPNAVPATSITSVDDE